jgi:hypothetical protein
VGRYATIAVVAKTVVYVAIVLSYYLLPEASLGHRAGGQARRPLALVVGLYAVPCVLLEGIAFLAPHQLLALVFPAHLLGAAGSLKILTAAMACLGLSFLLATYQLARGVRLAALWLLVGAIASVFVVATGNGHWRATTLGDLVAQLVIAAGLVLGTVVVLVRRRTS